MTDLTLCSSLRCPKFDICLRGQALPMKWRANYPGFPYTEDGCLNFISADGNKQYTVEFIPEDEE